MAATVSWEGLRELAGFRAANGCAITFYLGLDPSVAPTASDADVRVARRRRHAGVEPEVERDRAPVRGPESRELTQPLPTHRRCHATLLVRQGRILCVASGCPGGRP